MCAMFVKILPLMPVSSARTGQRPHSSLLAPLFPAGQYSQPKPHQTHNPNEGTGRNQRTTAVHFKGKDARVWSERPARMLGSHHRPTSQLYARNGARSGRIHGGDRLPVVSCGLVGSTCKSKPACGEMEASKDTPRQSRIRSVLLITPMLFKTGSSL